MKSSSPSKRFTSFVLRGPREAIFVAMLFSILPYFTDMALFLSWISMVVICLVSLRHGMKQGFYVLLWTVLPVLVLGVYQDDISISCQTIAFSFLLPWLLANVLRYTERWDWVFAVAVFLGTIGLICFVMLLTPLDAAAILKAYTVLFQKGIVNLPVEKASPFVYWLAIFLPGIQAVSILFSSVLNLVIARGMQASLFNPGGLKRELLQCRAHRFYALLIGLSGVAYYFDVPLGAYLLLVFSFPLVLSGLSLMHWFVERLSKGRLLVLVPVYVSMFMFMPVSVVPLMLFSMIDMVFDFRKGGSLALSSQK